MAREKLSRLQLLGQADNPLGILTDTVGRHNILLGKLLAEVGLGNVLVGIETPDTDVATHATSSSAHHIKYTDANAVDAVHTKYLDSDAVAAVQTKQETYIPFGNEPEAGVTIFPT